MTKRPRSRTREEKPRTKTHRIQLKYIDPSKKTAKEEIFETAFKNLEAPLTRLADTQSGFYATTDDQQVIDKLTSAKAIELFRKINLKPVEPPELRSKKTIFVRQVDSSAGGRAAEDIKTELQTNQTWLKIKEIIKIKDYTHVFKIVCSETQMANRILETGLNLFNTRIPQYNCEMEDFTHLLVCYKCYQIENHPTSECKSQRTVCSECAQEGHTWTTCTSDQKRCLNCPPERNHHRTLAAKCPKRRQAIEDKKNHEQHKEQQKKNATYSQIVKETVQQSGILQQQPPTQHLTLTSNLQIKLTAIIIEAHIASLTERGRYSEILSKSLKDNFDIDAKFPDRDSQAIFRTYIRKDISTTQEQARMEIPNEDDHYFDDDDLETNINLSAHHRTPVRNRYSLLGQETLPEVGAYHDLDLNFDEPRRIEPFQKPLSKSPRRQITPGKTRPSPTTTITTTRENTPLAASKPSDHTPLQIKRKTMEEVTSKQEESFTIAIYKSNNDPEPTPENITDKYIWENLNRTDQYGLKMTIDKGDPVKLINKLAKGTVSLDHATITPIPHEDFVKLARIPEQPTKRVRHSSAKRIP